MLLFYVMVVEIFVKLNLDKKYHYSKEEIVRCSFDVHEKILQNQWIINELQNMTWNNDLKFINEQNKKIII